MALANLIVPLRALPKHDERPALKTAMPETAQRYAHRWRVHATVGGLTERGLQSPDHRFQRLESPLCGP